VALSLNASDEPCVGIESDPSRTFIVDSDPLQSDRGYSDSMDRAATVKGALERFLAGDAGSKVAADRWFLERIVAQAQDEELRTDHLDAVLKEIAREPESGPRDLVALRKVGEDFLRFAARFREAAIEAADLRAPARPDRHRLRGSAAKSSSRWVFLLMRLPQANFHCVLLAVLFATDCGRESTAPTDTNADAAADGGQLGDEGASEGGDSGRQCSASTIVTGDCPCHAGCGGPCTEAQVGEECTINYQCFTVNWSIGNLYECKCAPDLSHDPPSPYVWTGVTESACPADAGAD
jgi:hypothetical protein